MSVPKDIVERRAKLISGLSGPDERARRVRYNMYLRYGDLAIAIYKDPVKEGLIRGNPDTFAVLTDPTVASWAYVGKSSDEFRLAADKYPELNKLFSNIEALQNGIAKIVSIIGSERKDISYEEFVKGITEFKPNNIVPLMDDIDKTEEEQFIDTDSYENHDDIEIDESEYYVDDEEAEVEPEVETEAEIEPEESSGNLWEDEPDPELEANTARVMYVYKDLYEAGFELHVPYGILVKEGVLRLVNGRTEVKSNASFARIYELINSITNKFLVQSEVVNGIPASKLRDIEMRMGTTYYPAFQLGNLYGIIGDKKVKTWSELASILEPEVRRNIKANLEAGKDIRFITDALTTSIVVSEFDSKVALKLRINIGNRLLDTNLFKSEYEKRRSSIMAGIGELFHIQQLRTGVVEVIIVFNRAAYHNRPIFAYEAVQELKKRGREPSISNMILGQDTSGKIYINNLNRQNASIILIGAGPRSGKGVLTLNLVGAILSDGYPLVYVDGKPDMAKELWRVAEKHGIKPAVWDAFDPHDNRLGTGAPKEVRAENSTLLGILAYLKVLQLMMAAAHLRSTKGIMVGGADKRPFFVFDEVLAVQQNLKGCWGYVVSKAKQAKNKQGDEVTEWCKAIVKWVEALSYSLSGTLNSQLPMSGISTVWLFQTIQPTTWSGLKLNGLDSDFDLFKHPIMARTSIKILGKGTTDSEYGLGNREIKGNKIVAELIAAEGGRHFAYTEVQKITDIEQIKIFKPYLVLNSAEPDADCVRELKNNVSSEVWNVIAPGGRLHPAAGFEGFLQLLGPQVIGNLALGRAFLEEIMQAVGLADKYSSVEEYLYDASVESFKSLGSLVQDPEVDEEAGPDGYMYVTGEGEKGSPEGFSYITSNKLDDTQQKSQIDTFGVPYKVVGGARGAVDEQFEMERQAREALENSIEVETDEGVSTDGMEEVTDNDLLRAVEQGELDAKEALKILVEKRMRQSTSMTGNDGRRVVVDQTQTQSFSKLTKDNCIDCRNVSPGPLSMIEKLMLDTPAGAQRYIDKLWNAILEGVVSKGYKKANITRVSIYGGQMYVNGRIVNLNGVIGGYENIRLRDIVSFRALFRKFFMIRELRLDMDMLRVAIAELGDSPIEKLFRLGQKLEIVYIQKENGEVVSFDRTSVMSSKAKEISSRGHAANELDMYCMAKSKNKWSDNRTGDNLWALRMAKSGLYTAGKMFMDRNKPSVGRAAIIAGASLMVGTVGAVVWGVSRFISGVLGLSSALTGTNR
jgi:hypothetical protein